ncbi:hypothetical protein [Luteolibacter sp. Populi]|uniref:hypothetical protein n=1 Tax=Luteolibacter sp. Populi TaxID=3230487 RepID=UPI0034652C2B
MKPCPSCIRLLLRLTLIWHLTLGHAQGRDLVPERWMEDMQAVDGSVQRCLIFRTVPGVNYRVEVSNDLVGWLPEMEIYGLGQEIAAPLVEFMPPPPTESPEPGPPVSSIFVSLTMQPSSHGSGGTVVSWRSLDSGVAVVSRIPEQLNANWLSVPLFAQRHDEYQLFVMHRPLAISPPTQNPPLGFRDTAMLAKLQERFADMNDAVTEMENRARLAPFPAPVSPTSRRFLRIHADWGVDSDEDGTPDWMEHEAAADPSHPDHDLGDAFNADVDQDGQEDDQQKDFDKDGILNPEDASSEDMLVNWERSPSARYAVFDLVDLPELPAGDKVPLHVTDDGKVLFKTGVWSYGSFKNLIRVGPRLVDAKAFAMGASGRILGSARVDFDDDEYAESGSIVYWDNFRAEPRIVEIDMGNMGIVHPIASYSLSYGFLDPGTMLDASDRFFCGERWISWLEPLNDPPVPPKPYEQKGEIVNRLWTLPQGNNGPPAKSSALPYATNLISDSVFWGLDSSNEGKLTLKSGQVTWVADHASRRVSVTPSGGYLASYIWPPGAAMTQGGAWKGAGELKDAIEMSRQGWAILNSIPPKIWMNGHTLPFESAAPGLPSNWTRSFDLRDSSPAGNILVYSGQGPDDRYGLAVPIHIEDVEENTGVDSVSITSSQPGSAVAQKHWIMVPSGGENTCVFCSTASSSSETEAGTTLDLLAPNTSFTPPTLWEERQTVKLSAPANLNTSDTTVRFSLAGQEALSKPVGLKIMKKRTVRLTVHKIATIRKDAGGNVISRNPPNVVPTKEALENYLNKIYGPQINATFDVVMNPPQAGAFVDIDWDKATGADFGVPDGDIVPGDAKFQCRTGDDNLSSEETILRGGAYDPGSEINAYLMGGAKINLVSEYQGRLLQKGGNYGYTKGEPQNVVYIDGDTDAFDEFLNRDPAAEQLHTFAHEIGHVLFGAGHPDQGGGQAPLPGTRHSDRLMVSGGGVRRPDHGKLVVKDEWDKAEDWLVQFVDSKIQP